MGLEHLSCAMIVSELCGNDELAYHNCKVIEISLLSDPHLSLVHTSDITT